MATERRYLKGDTVEVVEFPEGAVVGLRRHVRDQRLANGVVLCGHPDWEEHVVMKFYADQVKLVKRPWWNWLRLPFVKNVKAYQRSPVK